MHRLKIYFAVLFTGIFSGLFSASYADPWEVSADSLLAIIKQSDDDTVIMTAYGKLAELTALTDPFKALDYFNQAVRIGESLLKNSDNTIVKRAQTELEVDYYSIGELYNRMGNYRDAVHYLKKSAKLSRTIGNKDGMAYNLNSMGLIFYKTSHPDIAEKFYRSALKIFRLINSKRGIALVSNNLGRFYYMQNKNTEALELLNNALPLAEEIDDKEIIGLLLSNLGVLSSRKGNFEDALNYYFRWLEIEEESGNKLGLAYAITNISGLLFDQGRNDEAITYLDRALTLHREIGNKAGQAYIHNNLGRILFKINKDSASIDHYSKAIQLCEELGDGHHLALSLEGAGMVYEKLAGSEKALAYLQRSLGLYKDANDLEGQSSVLNNLAGVYFNMKKYTEAEICGKQSLELGRIINYPSNIENAALMLSKIYEEQKLFKHAYEYYAVYIQYKDSILNQNTVKQIMEMQTKYESEKKEKEIQILKKDQAIQKSEVARQKLMRNSFIGASLLALLLALLLYNRYQIKRRANIRLSEQNEKIMLQKNVIEEQKQNITDSIEYASSIQKAMLPADDEFRRLFPESFILYNPRDIVSGDFYWVASPPSHPPIGGKGIPPPPTGEAGRGAVLLCTADCTGHGVPGAFMSMLCTALLNEAVNDKGLAKPDEIFEEVRKGIIAALKQKGQTGGSKDGMDATIIALVNHHAGTPHACLPKQSEGMGASLQLRSSCANNPVYIVSNGILTEIKPDRIPVGVYEGTLQPFTLQETQLQKGDMIYTLTDGFEDQLGGEKGKKFKSAKLKELLITISTRPLAEQKSILEKTLDEWRGNGEQTDDVTVIGLRI